jgi:TPR repeat protein
MSMVKVLFFAADPLSLQPDRRTPRLSLDEDLRRIKEKVRAAEYRDVLDFDVRLAARPDDLLQALNEAHPRVVHFSGHGGKDGLVLVGDDPDKAHPVDAAVLAQLFRVFRGDIHVVVLSACFSRPQAEAIAAVVGCAIGTHGRISDKAAITFNASFYRAIAFGHSVQAAYDQARLALAMEHIADRECPELLLGPGVDATRLVLIPPSTADATRPTPPVAPSQDHPPPDVPPHGTPSNAARPADSAPPREVDSVMRSAATGDDTREPRRGGQIRRAGIVATVLLAALAGANLLDLPESKAEGTGTEAADSAADGMARPRSLSGPIGASPPVGEPSGAARELARAKSQAQVGNHAAAFPGFQRAAHAGLPEAMGYLGIAYLRGEGIARNADSAFHWLHKAAGARDARGMNGLAVAYETGQGVDRSLRWARHWYRAAAEERAYPEAMRNLARLYRDAVEPKYDSARIWYKKAMEAGSLEAMVDLGRMHEAGYGSPRDTDEARRLYRAAADAGSGRGMFELGRVYQDGVGLQRDFGEARAWYLKAVEAGSAEAMNNLGVMYHNGWGVPPDPDAAAGWFRRAAAAGSSDAVANLDLVQAG